MVRRKNNRKRKLIWTILFLILLGVAVAVCYFVWDGYFRDKKPVKQGEGASGVVIEGSDDVVEVVPDNGDEGGEEIIVKEEIEQYDGGNPNEAAELTGAITYAGVSGGNLMIRVNIDQYLSSGECMLLLATAGNTVYSNVAPIVSSASTATCEGFNVPMNLLESGQYDIKIEIESGEKKGIIKGVVAV